MVKEKLGMMQPVFVVQKDQAVNLDKLSGYACKIENIRPLDARQG